MDFDNMKKDKEFQKWCFDTELVGNKNWFNLENGSGDEVYIAYEAWFAGQQSKQAEIDGLEKKLKYEKSAYRNIKLQFLNKQDDLDELQAEIEVLKAKIEEIEKWAELHIKEYSSSESNSEHDRGWFNAACQVLKKVKGD